MPGKPDTIAIMRATLVVQDVRRSIAFYRDVLGLAQFADSCTTVSGKLIPAGLPGAHVHQAVMAAGSMEIGLLQWTDPPLAKPDDPYPIHVGIGDAAFAIETATFDAVQTRLTHAHEARVDASSRADGAGFFDPDGFFFTLRKADVAGVQLARMVLIVSDLSLSLPFYRDVLGLQVVSDTTGPLGNALLSAKEPNAHMRSVVLNSGGGVLELLCFIDPPRDRPARAHQSLGIGDAILVAQTDDVTAAHARLKESPARIHAAPGAHDKASSMSFFDPDGYFFELHARRAA